MEFNEFDKKGRSFFRYFVASFLGAVVGGILLLMFGPGTLFSKFNQQTPPPSIGQAQGTVPITSPQAITDIGYASSKVMPCVVGVTRPIAGKKQTGINAEVGTGVIVDPAGYILTNNHVADSSKELTISLYDGTNVHGKSVWADPILDFSVIKIDGTGNYEYARLGDSKAIRVGDTAIAIGNPLGLKFQRSVTSGIISALNRTVQMSANTFMEDLIQTDASINPGNSGGPLVNINGEVIGINTVKVETAEGMGFAIPINMAKPIIKSIKQTGKFVAPVLGVKGIDLDMASYFEYKVSQGVYVYDVTKGSPADVAGIKSGDSIISVNSTPINTLLDLKENLYNVGAGGTATIGLKTPLGTERVVSVTLQ